MQSDHVKGLVITVLGVLILTPDTLLIRLIGFDTWNILFWRGWLMAVGITILLVCFYGRRTPEVIAAIGGIGLAAAALFSLGTFTFIAAVTHTTVANTLIIVATAPFFAALLSWTVLGEAVPVRTLVAIVFTLGGISLLVFESFGTGNWIGDLAALATAIGLGLKFILLRRAKAINMVPAMALGGLITAAIAFFLATPVAMDTIQLIYLLLMGLVVMPLSAALIALGPRYLPAPEVSLIMVVETVLGPFWVWLVLRETPTFWALVGGGIVVATLVIHSAIGLKREAARARKAAASGAFKAIPAAAAGE